MVLTAASRVLFFRLFLIAALFSAGTGWNVGAFDRRATVIRRYQPTFVVLPRPEVARAASLGFRSLMADLYWVAAVNYFGDQRNATISYAQLANYMELVVTLDPEFEYAYYFAGVSLPWNQGKGWVNLEEAISFLKRGIEKFPRNWKMRFQLAFIYSEFQNRYTEAGDELKVVGTIPGAPVYAGLLAARMYAHTGDFDKAVSIAEELAALAPEPEVQQALLQRALEARAVKNLTRLEAHVTRFREQTGRNPAELAELVRERFIDAVPEEGLGGAWVYDPTTGTVSSSVLQDRLNVHKQRPNPDE